MNFLVVKDPATEAQLMIRSEHISAAEIQKEERSVTIYLSGGQMLRLTHEQSKQFLHLVKAHMGPAS
jgi:hypothetical protein